jgi:hypothetical protein
VTAIEVGGGVSASMGKWADVYAKVSKPVRAVDTMRSTDLNKVSHTGASGLVQSDGCDHSRR